ncbi:MAG TPA: alpha-glucan family phosphorylase, partial [Steroidobacteraceae bacterium]|nr:alpha-glucan family phosphorylase [Steroidobacteraceae bacterium]
VEAGHDRFSYALVRRLFSSVTYGGTAARGAPGAAAPAAPGAAGGPIDYALLEQLGGRDALNMTALALALSDFVNGVAQRHAEVSAQMYPGYQVRAITNGVHPYTWTAPGLRVLYDRHVPGWCHEPERLVRADTLPAEELRAAHRAAKLELLGEVRARTGVTLGEGVATLGFARRMTAYKRPDLLFADIERLRALGRGGRVQIVLAGKAHPHDAEGKHLIGLLHERARALAGDVAVVYLPDYDMALARLLVAGCDVWVNTPLPPLEASGTSGMKAAFNGVPSLSVLDGWWIEGCIENVTGWSIDGAATLYDKLANTVLPLFYDDRAGWARLMKGAISRNAVYFNSHRMMRRYAAEAYLR